MMTGSLKKRLKKKKNIFKLKKKRGGSLIRACSLIRSNTVRVHKITFFQEFDYTP